MSNGPFFDLSDWKKVRATGRPAVTYETRREAVPKTLTKKRLLEEIGGLEGGLPMDAEIFIHDESTDDDLPVVSVSVKGYSGAIMLRTESGGE